MKYDRPQKRWSIEWRHHKMTLPTCGAPRPPDHHLGYKKYQNILRFRRILLTILLYLVFTRHANSISTNVFLIQQMQAELCPTKSLCSVTRTQCTKRRWRNTCSVNKSAPLISSASMRLAHTWRAEQSWCTSLKLDGNTNTHEANTHDKVMAWYRAQAQFRLSCNAMLVHVRAL